MAPLSSFFGFCFFTKLKLYFLQNNFGRLWLQEQGLVEYEADIRSKGITEPHHLLRLTPAVIETLIPDKPIHQRKLAALSRGRNLNASTFSTSGGGGGAAPPKPAPFRSKSADDVVPEKAGLRKSDLMLVGYQNY